MIVEALKNKLVGLGYAESFIEPKLREFNMSILDNKTATESDIKASMFVKPTESILRFFLDVDGKLISKFVFDGNIQLKTVTTALRNTDDRS